MAYGLKPRYQIVTGGGGPYQQFGQDPDLASLLASAGYDGQAGGMVNIIGADMGNPVQQAILAKQGVLAEEEPFTQARVLPLGFVSNGPIAAGASANIIQQPQVVFRGNRLIVPSDIAGQFVIDDIRVGKDSMLAAVGGVPARTFDEQAQNSVLKFNTAQLSQQIAISVTNIGGAPATFRATLIGTTLE